jgi:hypothetical protein
LKRSNQIICLLLFFLMEVLIFVVYRNSFIPNSADSNPSTSSSQQQRQQEKVLQFRDQDEAIQRKDHFLENEKRREKVKSVRKMSQYFINQFFS